MGINEKLSRDRVAGFLKNEGGRIVNERGEEILLCGMGVGNWLLPEGYMWKLGGRYTRPASIEALVRHLCGSEYAARFWKTFRENYITEADVRAMATAGFNSVRLPVNWRIVMEDEPGIRWKEDGFALIDRFLAWCEKWKLYVCLDLHGAPGGQTGHNIDDSWDDIPRLFTDTESDAREKTLALWREFARRYRDRWIIGMYDLLNEPVRTPMEGTKELPDLSEELRAFYRDCIRAVREIDGRHMFSLESVFWASRADFFTERFDDNAAAHFHRYWCPPDITVLRDFLAVRERLGIALYLGETGENDPRWFAAMYPLALANDIGVNIWPWKKMETGNSPCSVRKPAGWDWITGFARGGDRPSYAR
ncbi:MAG: cellulase family glycosylhydrolase, partial [Clostridia bacterium]|nr:cellulase family glycosylhydrolase [Clostridia bacterium]